MPTTYPSGELGFCVLWNEAKSLGLGQKSGLIGLGVSLFGYEAENLCLWMAWILPEWLLALGW